MKIAVAGATGMIGSRVVAEAVSRGHDVTAVTRNSTPEHQPNVTPLTGDITDSAFATAVADSHDVVVSAIAPSGDEDQLHITVPKAVLGLAQDARSTRLLVIGGAGSLLTPSGARLLDLPEFHAAWLPVATAHAEALDALRRATDLGDWTYLSPAPMIAPGERTGEYNVSDDTPAGENISAEDFAVAVVDEIERPAHSGRRFTVAN